MAHCLLTWPDRNGVRSEKKVAAAANFVNHSVDILLVQRTFLILLAISYVRTEK